MPINEESRPYLEWMRMLARDDEGREVLIGLNYDDSEWYFAFQNDRHTAHTKTLAEQRAERDRYLELDDRHELARRRILTAENEARDRPLKN